MDNRLRPFLDDDNSQRVRDALKLLYEQHGIQISSQEFVNIILASVKLTEFHQHVKVVIQKPKSPDNPSENPGTKAITKKTNWVTRL